MQDKKMKSKKIWAIEVGIVFCDADGVSFGTTEELSVIFVLLLTLKLVLMKNAEVKIDHYPVTAI